MFSKVIIFCAVAAVSQAGLLPEPHYAPAVSSQSIIRHDEGHAPIAKVAIAAPVYKAEYHAAPVYHSAPVAHAPVYHSAPIAHAPVYHSAPVYHAAPVAHAPVYHAAPVAHYEEDAHPKYEYNYSVQDGHTGDFKSQQEHRDGDVVKGSYSLHEADGSIRTVEYTADDHNGFNAVVHNSAPKAAPVLVKAHAPVYAAAPAIAYHH